MGSLAYPPADVGKFEVVGGLFGEPLEVAACATIDLAVPAAAEIVIEGEILPGVREPEGPFGEFTGYFSRRSTEHVFQAKALAMRAAPWFQSIGSGRAGDHITTLALVREADVRWAVATRMQADRDLVTIAGSLGAMLDPSADERGVTAKLGIDATRPFGEPFGEKLVMDPAKMAWARALVDRLGG